MEQDNIGTPDANTPATGEADKTVHTSGVAAMDSPTPPDERGPVNFVVACALVSKKYGSSLNSVNFRLEPVIRDGSVVEFYIPGSATTIAQGRLRFANSMIFDKEGNAQTPVHIHDITYPRDPLTVRLSQQ